jgi:hypothetical protein
MPTEHKIATFTYDFFLEDILSEEDIEQEDLEKKYEIKITLIEEGFVNDPSVYEIVGEKNNVLEFIGDYFL